MQRHTNFLENFMKEGQQLKDEIIMLKNSWVQGTAEVNSSKKLVNTNISQVLSGARLRYGRLRSRYKNNTDLQETQFA